MVMDLDGTLYSANTFHLFLKYMVYQAFRSMQWLWLIQLILYMVMRGLRMISHKRLKFHVLRHVHGLRNLDIGGFVASIDTYKRNWQTLIPADTEVIILATAAPEIYSKIIADREQFTTCVATLMNSKVEEDFEENMGEVKLRNVNEVLRQMGIPDIDYVMTDHLDDWPLIKQASHTYLVQPSADLVRKVKAAELEYTIVN